MYKAKLISADFEESTMEFEIQHEFTAKKGDYVILTEKDFNDLSQAANKNTDESKQAKCIFTQHVSPKINTKEIGVIVGIEDLSEESKKILESKDYVPRDIILTNLNESNKDGFIECMFIIPDSEFFKQKSYNHKIVHGNVKLKS